MPVEGVIFFINDWCYQQWLAANCRKSD